MSGWKDRNTSLLATQLIWIRFFIRMVFFALIIMMLARKPSSLVTFTSHTSMNFLVAELSFQVLPQGDNKHVRRQSRGSVVSSSTNMFSMPLFLAFCESGVPAPPASRCTFLTNVHVLQPLRRVLCATL